LDAARRGRPEDHRRLPPPVSDGPQLSVRLHAARGPHRPLEDVGAPGLLQREHVSPDEPGEPALPVEAHELPGPYPDLQVHPAFLP